MACLAYIVTATADGEVASTLKEESPLARGTLLARITQPDKKTVEIRSPLPGKLERIIAASGSRVVPGAAIMTINSDEDSLWEALRGLALIGESQDAPAIESYANGSVPSSDRIRQQAALAIKAIQSRAKQK